MECQDAKLEGNRSHSANRRLTVGRILALFGVALLVLTANVVASILYMVLYGHVIDPGHDPKYYEAHIQMAGPYCSIVAGIPISIFAGWWVAGWWQRSLKHLGAILVWLAYTIVDLLVLVFVGMTLTIVLLFTISFATKLAAIYWGASLRLRHSLGSEG